jgi:hypothetical protein
MPWPFGNKCHHLINYDGVSLSFSGLEGPGSFDVKLSSLKVNREVLQVASEIAQLYDMYQFSNCQQCNMLPENSPERTQFLLESQRNGARLLELLSILKIVAARPSETLERALADWVAHTYSSAATGVDAPLLPPGVATRGATRSSPPAKEINQIKRSLAKAKTQFPYLGQALKNPKFDMDALRSA